MNCDMKNNMSEEKFTFTFPTTTEDNNSSSEYTFTFPTNFYVPNNETNCDDIKFEEFEPGHKKVSNGDVINNMNKKEEKLNDSFGFTFNSINDSNKQENKEEIKEENNTNEGFGFKFNSINDTTKQENKEENKSNEGFGFTFNSINDSTKQEDKEESKSNNDFSEANDSFTFTDFNFSKLSTNFTSAFNPFQESTQLPTNESSNVQQKSFEKESQPLKDIQQQPPTEKFSYQLFHSLIMNPFFEAPKVNVLDYFDSNDNTDSKESSIKYLLQDKK